MTIDAERNRHDRTREQLANVTQQFANLCAQKSQPTTLPERARDEVIEAILAKAQGRREIQSVLGQYARMERAKHTSDADIIAAIQHGQTDDDSVPI